MVKEELEPAQDRKWIAWMSGVVVIIVVLTVGAIWIQHEQIMNAAESSFAKTTNSDLSDHERFAEEYTKLTADNVFVYRQEEDILKVLEKGNGIVFFCSASDEWCQYYAQFLNESAKAEGVEKVFYYDVAVGRNSDSAEYRQIVSKLDGYTLFDELGTKQVFIPNTFFIANGKIVGYENSTMEGTLDEDAKPEDYWTTERIEALNLKLKNNISALTTSE